MARNPNKKLKSKRQRISAIFRALQNIATEVVVKVFRISRGYKTCLVISILDLIIWFTGMFSDMLNVRLMCVIHDGSEINMHEFETFLGTRWRDLQSFDYS